MVRTSRQTNSEGSPAPAPADPSTPELSATPERADGQNTDLHEEYVRFNALQVRFRRIDRFLILGEGLSGKSYLAEAIISQTPRRVIITPNSDEWLSEPNRIIARDEETLLRGIKQTTSAGNCLVVLDDLDVMISKMCNDPRSNFLFKSGRHAGCGWMAISRRTADLPTIVFKQANKAFLFQTDLPQDLKIFRDYYNCADAVKNLNRAQHQCLFIDRDRKTRTVIIAA